jgi:hypothetical protein
MKRVVGVVYPIPFRLVERLFVARRNVFVKYISRITNLKLAPKQKLVFYASHDLKEVVGEAVIDTIEFLTPDEVLEKYGCKVFLDKHELAQYMMRQPKRSPSKKMLTLTLSRLRKYPLGVKYERPITMAGEYLTKEQYDQLLKKVSKT